MVVLRDENGPTKLESYDSSEICLRYYALTITRKAKIRDNHNNLSTVIAPFPELSEMLFLALGSFFPFDDMFR